MTFLANLQAPLSGNSRYWLWMTLGCLVAYPLPIYVIPFVLLSPLTSKYTPLLIWAVVWANASVSVWVWLLLFTTYYVIESDKIVVIYFCALPLVFKALSSQSLDVFAYAFSILPMLGYREIKPIMNKGVISVLPIYVVISSWVIWNQKDIDALHNIGLLSFWKNAHGLSHTELARTIHLEPYDHNWIIEQSLPLENKIAAGWRPEEASLDTDVRIDVARLLDKNSRKGEAVRLLKKTAKNDPISAWEYMRLLRLDGQKIPNDMSIEPPADTLNQGQHEIDEWWTHNKCRTWFVHSDSKRTAVTVAFEVESSPIQKAELLVQLDSNITHSHYPMGMHDITQQMDGIGPHSLKVCFTNDSHTTMGDINVRLIELLFVNDG